MAADGHHPGRRRHGQDAADQVDHWCRYVLPQVFDDPAGWAMQNMLIVARLMIAAATERKESRGVHSRPDFPDPDPTWNSHITLQYPPIRTSEGSRKRAAQNEDRSS